MTALPEPSLSWREGTPYSERFGDVYFSADDGPGERRHVFLEGVGAPAAWRGRSKVVIGEIGFGTGLTFLLTRDLWLRSAPPTARLYYLAAEAHPFSGAALRAVHAASPHAGAAAALAARWPDRLAGPHRLALDHGRIVLTLLFGDAATMLADVDVPSGVDAWFLDGFAPDCNPEMWSEALLHHVARLSASGARLASFTVAGLVRRRLGAVGFAVEMAPGFGRKRACLRATYQGLVATRWQGPPWFAPPPPLPDGATVAVIGGGIAGLSLAAALRLRNVAVTVYEAGSGPGAGASGARAVMIEPPLRRGDALEHRLASAAFLYAIRWLRDGPAGESLGQPERGTVSHGVMRLAHGAVDATRLWQIAAENRWLSEDIVAVTAADAADHVGLRIVAPGAWLPRAACVRPGPLLAALAAMLPLRRHAPVAQARYDGERWRLQDRGGALLGRADAVVMAPGPFLSSLWPDSGVPLIAKRGQVCHLEATAATRHQRAGLSGGGYVTPPFGDGGRGLHVAGSSFTRWEGALADEAGWRGLWESEDQQILKALPELSPDFAGSSAAAADPGWAALRAMTLDRLPVAGPAPDCAALRSAYAELRHGRPLVAPASSVPYHPELFLFTGLGARGFSLAPLLAEALADSLTGAPAPLARDLLALVHPARFVIRALRRL